MRVELRAVWPGDDIHWIVFLGKVVADPAGRPVCMRGITIDGTRRRRGEEAVHDLAERLRLAMDAGRLAAWEVDLVKRVLRWSPEAAACTASLGNRWKSARRVAASDPSR